MKTLLLFLLLGMELAQANIEGFRCGQRTFGFTPNSNGWSIHGFNQIEFTGPYNIRQKVDTRDSSYEMQNTSGQFEFDLIEGRGSFVVIESWSCGGSTCSKTISSDKCEYTSFQPVKEPDFYTLDFCFGYTRKIDDALYDGKIIDSSKKFLGYSPFTCSLVAPPNLEMLPFILKRKDKISIDPNERLYGEHPLFLVSGTALRTYISSLRLQIEFLAKDKNGNSLLEHYVESSDLDSIYDLIPEKQRLPLLGVKDPKGNLIFHLKINPETLKKILSSLSSESKRLFLNLENNGGETPTKASYLRFKGGKDRELELQRLLVIASQDESESVENINILFDILETPNIREVISLLKQLAQYPGAENKVYSWSSQITDIWKNRLFKNIQSIESDFYIFLLDEFIFPALLYPEIPIETCRTIIKNSYSVALKIKDKKVGGRACLDYAISYINDRYKFQYQILESESSSLAPNGMARFSFFRGTNVVSTQYTNYETLRWWDFYEDRKLIYLDPKNPWPGIEINKLPWPGDYDSRSVEYTDNGMRLASYAVKGQMKQVWISNFGSNAQNPTVEALPEFSIGPWSYIDAPASIRVTDVKTLLPTCLEVQFQNLFTKETHRVEIGGLDKDPKTSGEKFIILNHGLGFFGNISVRNKNDLILPGSTCERTRRLPVPTISRFPFAHWVFKKDLLQDVFEVNDTASKVTLATEDDRFDLDRKIVSFDGQNFYAYLPSAIQFESRLLRLHLQNIEVQGSDLTANFKVIASCHVPHTLEEKDKLHHIRELGSNQIVLQALHPWLFQGKLSYINNVFHSSCLLSNSSEGLVFKGLKVAR